MGAEPREGLGSFSVIHKYECFTFTWSKWQFSLLPSSWQNLQWPCPCPQDKIKTPGLTQISGQLGPHLCHQHYHPPLVTQSWAQAPRLHLISDAVLLLLCLALWSSLTHCSSLVLHPMSSHLLGPVAKPSPSGNPSPPQCKGEWSPELTWHTYNCVVISFSHPLSPPARAAWSYLLLCFLKA